MSLTLLTCAVCAKPFWQGTLYCDDCGRFLCVRCFNRHVPCREGKKHPYKKKERFCFGCGFAHPRDYADCVWNKEI